eukprot:2101297-Amphidinium_carterae.1
MNLEAWQTRRRGNGPTAARPKKAAFAVPCALATSTAETWQLLQDPQAIPKHRTAFSRKITYIIPNRT